ncbi:MAG: hypothetical protein IJZ57_10660 [Clostridia bacterium]|nr:hypothetical protein [Clostridia bacterium]
MKRRVTERVLVLILSVAVLLSSTGIYTVFATQENTAGSEAVTDSSTVAGESAQAQTDTQENIVEGGGAIEAPTLSGEGTAAKPYKIATVDDLFLMQEIINDSTKQDKNFSLVADIDLSGVTASDLSKNTVTPGTIISIDKTLSDATPKSVWFNFNGCGHKLYGLNVTSTEFSSVAIFGYISKNSTVKNITVEACNITLKNEKATEAAVIAVYNDGTVRNSTVSGAKLSVQSAASGAVAGAVVAKNNGVVSDITVKNAKVSAACGVNALSAVAGVNGGTISAVKVTGASVTASEKNETSAVGAVAGVNNSQIKNCAVSVASMAYGKQVGGVAGVNAGEINNCSVNGGYDTKSAVSKADATIISGGVFGAVAGTNNGKVTSCSASEVSAFVLEGGVYGGVAGVSGKASVISGCVASGAVGGKGVAGGIAGRTEESATIKNNYSFVSLMADSARGAVIGEGKANVENNLWSSEISGRYVAYQSGSKQGDMIASTRVIAVNAGESKAVNLSAFGGEWGAVSMSATSVDSVSLAGSGVELKKSENGFTLKALSANKTAKLTYSAKFTVKAGFNNASVVSRDMSVSVITLEKDAQGDGLSAETPIKIAKSTELEFLKAAPFAYFELTGDVDMPENWSAFDFCGYFNGAGYTLNADAPLFSGVFGSVENLTVKLNGEIKSAVFGDANSAKFSNVRLVKGQVEEGSEEVIRLVAEKSSVSPFLNKVMGNTVVDGCYAEIPVHIAKEKVANVAGLMAVVNANGAKITSSGASVAITSDFEEKVADSAAVIGKVVDNTDGTISGCFGTVKSTVVDYALVGAGNKDNFKVENSYISSHNENAAPAELDNVASSKWLFDAGEQGFIAGKGSVVSITLPKEIALFSAVSAEDFEAGYNAEELKVNTSGITVEDGVLYLPVEAADDVITVLNSKVTLVHKPTGLCATIGVSNGLEKDADGNYIIYYAVDIAFIGDNMEKFNGASFKLANDIDMSKLADFKPVGGTEVAFNGVFDGCGYTISGLTVGGTSKAALFGALENATVKNLVIDGASVSASGSYAGVLAGQLNSNTSVTNVTIKNSSVSAAEGFAGAVAGSANGENITVSNVKLENISSKALNNAGGVIGFVEGECAVANAEVKSASVEATNFAGGVAGSANAAKIINIKVLDAKISAVKNAGGVAGAFAGEIKSAEVNATVSGDVAGGFIGSTVDNTKAVIADSKVNVKVVPAEGAISAGGFVASVSNGSSLEIANAVVAKGSAIGASMASGGFIGDVQGKASVSDSVSYASVEGIKSSTKLSVGAGGVIGKVSCADLAEVSVKNVNVAGKVSAYDYAGGIIGNVISEKSSGVAVSDCVVTAEIISSQAENSGIVIGAVSEDVVSSVKSAVFSSYGCELGAYGSAKGEGTYTDLDKCVSSSLGSVITSSDEITVNVNNSKTSELGFVFDSEAGWQSESADRISVISGNENAVVIKANKSANCAVVATYTLSSDSNISLNVHFEVESDIKLTLEGSGTQADPYRISDGDDLDAVRDYVGEGVYFVLTNDITFADSDFVFGGSFYNKGAGFAPLGTDEAPFTGVFDGAGYSISGLYVNDEEASLFGTISGAEIKNVNINISATGASLAAGVATKAYNSKISGVTVSGNICVTAENGSVAGVVAYANNSEIANATVNSLTISTPEVISDNGVVYAAGVVARAVESTISAAKVESDVTVKSAGYAGGVVGYGADVSVINADTKACVSGEFAGAIFANINSVATVSNAVAGGEVNGTTAAGVAGVANGTLNASDVVVSAVISGETAGVVAGIADEEIYSNENIDVKLENIIYSSYQNSADMFGEASLNSYQLANCAEAFVDVNNVKAADGEFVAVGKEPVMIKDAVELMFNAQGDAQSFTLNGIEFNLADASTQPENLVSFNGESVAAVETAIDGAQLVMTYANGIATAVDMISVNGMVGDGTEQSPYLISNEDTLSLLDIYPNASFALVNDITLSGEWTPVDSFSGVIDGNGFTVYALEVNAENAGLIETVADGAEIRNITFDSASVTGSKSAGVVAAMVCGDAVLSDITVNNSTVKADEYAAAIAGVANSNGCEISACEISGCSVEAENAAGIAAAADGDSLVITGCSVSADVRGKNAAAVVAVADCELTVTDCMASGAVNGEYAESGIIAVVSGELSGKMRVSDNVVSAQLSNKAENSASVVGVFEALPEDNEAFAQMFSNNTVTNGVASFQREVMQYQNFDGVEIAPEVEVVFRGEGTEDSPYEIYSVAELNAIPDGSDAYFVLMNNITITPEDYDITTDENGNTVYGALHSGYSPIKDFAGSFDGNGYVISGLYIESDADYVGLFANIKAGGKVKNVHLEVLEEAQGFGFSGITGSAFVGGIAGYCEAVDGIINCSVEGGVISGERAVGAIVGELASSKLDGCVATSVVKSAESAGGLVGVTKGNSSVINSVTAVTVDGIGGTIVGINDGNLTVKDILSTGSTKGGNSITVGANDGELTIEKAVIGGTNAGATANAVDADEISLVYSDVTALGTSDNGVASVSAGNLMASIPEGLDGWALAEGCYPAPKMADRYSAVLTKLASVPVVADVKEGAEVINGFAYPVTIGAEGVAVSSSALSGEADLYIDGNKIYNDSYTGAMPYAVITMGEMSRVAVLPQRSDENVLYVSHAKQLTALANPEGKYSALADYLNNPQAKIVLTADIDFGADALSEANSVEPIKGFTGSFDGNGYSINNLRVDAAKGEAGLFATVGGDAENVAQFTDITFNNVYISGRGVAGALAGSANEYTEINNVRVENSSEAGYVSGAVAGAVVGSMAGGAVSNAYADITVDGVNIAGGLIGASDAVITGSNTFGKVNAHIENSALAGVGGLVGVMNSGAVYTSSSLADVTVSVLANAEDESSVAGVGGLVGVARGEIEQSFSAGSVKVSGAEVADATTTIGIGGLAGVAYGKIESVYSASAVTADFIGGAEGEAIRALGGLVGVAYGEVKDAYASGGVSATSAGVKVYGSDCFTGGVIGYAFGADYENLYFDKYMNNDENLTAVSNIINDSCYRLTTDELIAGEELSSAFALGEGTYPYLKAMLTSEESKLSSALSAVVTLIAEDDASALAGSGATKAVTLPNEITLGKEVYSLEWLANSSASVDGTSAQLNRTKPYADYMSLTLNANGVSKTYDRLYTDVGVVEATIGNTEVEHKLTNESGDGYMDSALVGILIKSRLSDGSVVTSDIFTSCDSQVSKMNKLLVTSGGFYVDSSIASGYEISVTAKDGAGNEITVTDAGAQGVFVETANAQSVVLEISIVKKDIPWGLTSLWESLVR